MFKAEYHSNQFHTQLKFLGQLLGQSSLFPKHWVALTQIFFGTK